MDTAINVVIFQRDKWWIAQCLQYDIGAQAHSIEDVKYAFCRAVMGHMAICQVHEKKPFVDLPAAPEAYWKKFRSTTLRIQSVDEEPAFTMPTSIPPPRAEFRIAA